MWLNFIPLSFFTVKFIKFETEVNEYTKYISNIKFLRSDSGANNWATHFIKLNSGSPFFRNGHFFPIYLAPFCNVFEILI